MTAHDVCVAGCSPGAPLNPRSAIHREREWLEANHDTWCSIEGEHTHDGTSTTMKEAYVAERFAARRSARHVPASAREERDRMRGHRRARGPVYRAAIRMAAAVTLALLAAVAVDLAGGPFWADVATGLVVYLVALRGG